MKGVDRYREQKEQIFANFVQMPRQVRQRVYLKLANLVNNKPKELPLDPDNPDLPAEFVSGALEAMKETEEPLTHEEVFGELYAEPWSIRDAARFLGVSEMTVRRYIKSGVLPADRPVKKYLIDYRDLRAFRKQRAA